MNCKCTFAQRMVGDGCDICNPKRALEYADRTIADLEQRLSKAVEIIEQYHEWFAIAMCSSCGAVSMAYAETCGKDPYHDEAIGICKRARAFLADEQEET